MIGSRFYPCGHGKARFPAARGVYDRRCTVCGRRWKVLVKVAKYTSERVGREVLKLEWYADDVAS